MKKLNPSSASCLLLTGAASILASACNDPAPVVAAPVVVNVTTYHNDLARTGQNLHETTLTRSNVNTTAFGKIGALPVDGLVYAQPLTVQGVQTSAGLKNLVFVETEHDSVYAFDTASLSKTPVWKRNFINDCITSPSTPANCSTPLVSDVGAPNITPEVGITATPVIDVAAGTMYVTAMSKESGAFYWRVHALSLATGAEQPGSPITVDANFPGIGNGMSTDGLIYFDALRQLSRAGLVLNGGLLEVAFTSFNDQEPTHGWVFAYNASTLEPVSAWMTTPNSGDGTIWQAGGAPAVDSAGNMYFSTGNGDANYATTVTDLADSILKLTFGPLGFDLTDYFTPYNHVALALGDVDVGSGGVLLLPDQPGAHPHLLMGGGKQGTIYLIDRDNMGKLNSATGATSNTNIVQELVGDLPGGRNSGPGIYGTPSYYNGKVYIVAAGDFLRSIPLANGQLNWAGMSAATHKIANRGATASISANGTTNGIVWFIDASAYSYRFVTGGANPTTLADGSAVLYAYNSDDLTTPLYSAPVANLTTLATTPNLDVCTTSGTDAAGCAVKFSVPTVSNGQVFVGTNSEISVYGLRANAPSGI